MADMTDRGGIVFYQIDSGKPAIEVRMAGGTVWLAQAQMAELFQTTPQNITQHLRAIFAEGELTESATCKDDLQVRHALKRLNTLVSAYFDAAEFRAMNQESTYMKDWLSHLEQLSKVELLSAMTLTSPTAVCKSTD